MAASDWQTEVARGRTFAIISHPDAGKTTLTEKLLLFGGAIREAGAVKARRAQAHARSDWMEIERQRGISVTTTVLQFPFEGYRVNLLDTPGHQDFGEDTYRTLMAADSAVMVIDGAKGVQAQTRKLYQVCRRRAVPVVTFVNKLDRESKDPWELMADIERQLDLLTYPINWPIGSGAQFQGLYHRDEGSFETFQRTTRSSRRIPAREAELADDHRATLAEAEALLNGAAEPWDDEAVQSGLLSPVFFGSAMANFGVETFLRGFLGLSAGPMPRATADGEVRPEQADFSGFVFKIQANMNPAHRDRVAFVRVVSGMFERGMTVLHPRSGRSIRLNQPQQFLAQDRTIVETAYPGDIIGLHDNGLFRIGDTLTVRPGITFAAFPRFTPEIFAEVELKYTLKHKQFQRGIRELTEEGLIQRFLPLEDGPEVYLGVVGSLQFDVLSYRMQQEYGVDITLRTLPYTVARRIASGPDPEIGRFDRARLIRDADGRHVVLAEDLRTLDRLLEKTPGLILRELADESAG
ncbi:MAG: peptide chain release factor 3 [Thermaerobacter sp.]|nr:peptide chain release factor 3 [Thermaerobacter sp.]